MDSQNPVGLWIFFHGWTMDYNYISRQEYNKYVDLHNFLIIYPSGQSDYNGIYENDGWSSWNIGDHDPETFCTTDIKHGYCYDSCKQIPGECDRCSWTSCYDDVFFIQELMKKMRQDYTIDESKVVLIGGSNGGMFTNYLAGKVDASHFIPLYGNPPIKHYPDRGVIWVDSTRSSHL